MYDKFARATRDIDLLAGNMPNNVGNMRKVFESIFSVECDDALWYDLDGIELKEAIKETFEHRGTGFDDIFAFTDDFIASEIHQNSIRLFYQYCRRKPEKMWEDMRRNEKKYRTYMEI